VAAPILRKCGHGNFSEVCVLNPIYRLSDVSYAYLNRFAAIDIDHLDIPRSSRVALIGANGSGKSTLLKLLDALYFPQRGRIEFDGTALTEESFRNESVQFSFRKRVGFLFQDPEVQLFSPTVWDEICFGPLQIGWEKDRIRNEAEGILRQFGLETLRDRPPYRLSLGEKKKVALASVLIIDPEVLLLDEPTAALDPRTQSTLLELLHMWREDHKTIVTSTHDLSILKEICDQVFVMHEGSVVGHGSANEVLDNEKLLEETNLIHTHTHRHAQVEHLHPHTHDFHGHTHEAGEKQDSDSSTKTGISSE
jgi:cobalt/nickel transport system ATP-binding protein